MSRYYSSWWSIAVAEGWHAQEDVECITIVASPPRGALQISAARKEVDVVDSELSEFYLETIPETAEPELVTINRWRGHRFQYSIGDLSWRIWYLFQANTLVMATFITEAGARNGEFLQVERMITSLRIETSDT
jgi:hypothetical protein